MQKTKNEDVALDDWRKRRKVPHVTATDIKYTVGK